PHGSGLDAHEGAQRAQLIRAEHVRELGQRANRPRGDDGVDVGPGEAGQLVERLAGGGVEVDLVLEQLEERLHGGGGELTALAHGAQIIRVADIDGTLVDRGSDQAGEQTHRDEARRARAAPLQRREMPARRRPSGWTTVSWKARVAPCASRSCCCVAARRCPPPRRTPAIGMQACRTRARRTRAPRTRGSPTPAALTRAWRTRALRPRRTSTSARAAPTSTCSSCRTQACCRAARSRPARCPAFWR